MEFLHLLLKSTISKAQQTYVKSNKDTGMMRFVIIYVHISNVQLT